MPTQLERDARLMWSVLAASDDCIKVLDLEGRLTFMSEGGKRVMEVADFGEIEGCSWPDFWEGDGNAQAKAAVTAALAGGTGHFQGPANTMAGTPKWWDVQVKPILGPDGKPERLLSISRDITEQVVAREALAKSESRYRTLFESMDEGFCIIEFFDGPHGPLSDYVHIEANPAYAAHAGIPNVVGQKVREMVGAEADDWVERYGAVLRTGKSIRFERELEATGRYLNLSAFRIEPASLNQVAVLFQDITARRQAEIALRELNATLENRIRDALAERKVLADIVEGTSAFVQVVGLDFRWLAINSASAGEFERIFGVRPQVGHNMLDLLADHPADCEDVRTVWQRALDGEEFVEIGEFGFADRDRRHYEMRFGTLRDEQGRQIGAYQFVYDVTERLAEQQRLAETEDALRQAQKMEAVGQLTGGIAHDFNNLLTGVTGSLEMLQTRIAQGRYSETDRYINAAQGAARRAASLTHRLLAFSRRQTLDPKPTDVNRLVREMDELIRRTVGPQVSLEVVTAAGLWPTLVDPPQLENALLNLCINARDAMPAGGRITVETANKWLDEREARERDMEAGQYIALCVTDTGTGMTPDVISRAFDPFFTTKPIGQGTGLGLSMIYGFVRQSGGQVRIYSEVGEGTTMCLYLPRHYSGEVSEPLPPLAPLDTPAQTSAETILVVDDEPTIRMLAVEVLEELGYQVIDCWDGPSALKVLETDQRIDLLITDVGLPGGMNGRQLADAARVFRPDLKIIFITGYAENAVLGNGQLSPGMQLMTKPFAMEALGQKARNLIQQGS